MGIKVSFIIFNMIRLLPFLSLLVIFSCSNVDQETVTEIEKWQEKLDSAYQVYLTTDFDSISRVVWRVSENEKAIKRLNTSDTIYTDMVAVLDSYKWIRKSVKYVDNKKFEYGAEFEEIKVQLENLKLDVQNGVRTTEENQQYLSNEIKAIKNLIGNFSEDKKIYDEALKRYGELGGKVQAYVDQLKREKGIIK